ncbi:MarR family winged helix-turn-helix transcriptional regulator [Novosphingobium piscinae]|uniref:MarR family transcriptional regulator n=1 Tax=Novosphingobium piscinae TaxID=1507448 RepID=A0A7X1FV75_9SPHN|nr:MarR family transcriptional regulator [Novosphingobium piscinae]MBC2667593.1 MarR family transcriptional regulator [Novosphingobium piscinae]
MKQGQDLQQLIGYLAQRLQLIGERDAREALQPFGITPAKLTALLLVRDNPGCDQSALGRALSINRASTMRQVNILEERGLIERRPGRDARTNALYLTPFGEAQTAAMVGVVRECDRRLTSPLTTPEVESLRRLLVKLTTGKDRVRIRRKAAPS